MRNDEAFGSLYEECLLVKDRDFPIIIDCELTNFCNMKCKFCPTGEGTSTRQKGFMSDTTWYLVLTELIKHKAAVRFVGWGEPTLHPMLWEWVEQAHNLGVMTHITSNGRLKYELAFIANRNLDSFRISDHKDHHDLTVPPKEYLPCPKVHSMLTVQWNGNVTACQGDYDGVMVLGNVNSQTLGKLWKWNRMEQFRTALKAMQHADFPLCKNCARKEGK